MAAAPECANRQAYQRMNFLLQLGAGRRPWPPRPPLTPPPAAALEAARDNAALARFYSAGARALARRLVLRLEPALRRALCRRCDALLAPGAAGTTVRVRARRERHAVTTCGLCGARVRARRRRGHAVQTERAPLAPL